MSNICGDGVMLARSLFQVGDGGAIPTSPHQFEFIKIKPQLACELNAKWHSRLPIIDWSNITRNTHYICYAAIYDYAYYAVALWSSPVAQNRFKDGKNILELRRMAISNSAPPNTATRMIGWMIKDIKRRYPELTRLISYQDTEVHKGTIYKASNWKSAQETPFISWTNRKRNPDQSKATKIRWEYTL